jgi:hypothetical protein
MSKLIGTNPNQVPSNADLGTAAFMDKKELLLSKGSSLSAIDAIVDKTAIRVFVYDTRKDSDGGAWRKRTQHTSWYNERLNTLTRGSRKEFPAVAVIVIESTKVTIYDGDDLNMPMWMVFEQSGYGNMLGESNNNAVAMLNARIALGCNPYDLYVVDFLKDSGWSHSNDVVISGTYFGNISQRNIGTGQADADSWIFGTVPNIINRTINDVAMTVLPNAPIDTATGLPVPTIAVGTAGGTSIIKDDGSIVDITWSNGSHSNLVTFIDNKVFIAHDFSGAVARHGHLFNIPQSDLAEGAYYSVGSAVEFYGPSGFKLAPRTESYVNITEQAGPAFGYAGYLAKYSGLAFLERNESDYTRSSVANITTEYNTGYMVGDIKLATLSDTDDTNITFADKQLIDEPYFNASTGWYFNGSGASGAGASSGNGWTIAGGKITQSGSGGDFYAVIPVVDGRQYVMQLTFDTTCTSSFNNVSWGFRSLANSGYLHTMSTHASLVGNTANQTKNIFWTANTTGNIIARVYSGEALSIDNFTVHIAEPDRSVNGKGLQVLGTVTKTAVATGADLMGYSGFSASNYLQQPHNSSLDFSGDFCIQTWMYIPSDTTSAPYHYGYTSDQDQAILALYVAGNGLRTYTRESGGNWNYIQSSVTLNSWIHVTHQRKSGIVSTSINGILTAGSYTHNANLTRSGNVITLGRRIETTQTTTYWRGSLALFRLSNTALSQEQIKKIYNDEKHLFQENAKATLYGTSDTVTAVAYDDDTKLIHAGTSAGRSVFQGLRRIDNTTDAVSIDISASNGMVVEE